MRPNLIEKNIRKPMLFCANFPNCLKKALKDCLSTLLLIAFPAVFVQAATVSCPMDYTVQLPAGQCAVPIFYDTLAWSSTVEVVDTFFFPLPGTLLETGTTEVFLTTLDLNGDLSTCSFFVTILSGNSTALECPSSVFVGLENQCERALEVGEILGNSTCPGDYLLQRLTNTSFQSPAEVSAQDIGTPVTVRVINVETLAQCETEVFVTGGTPPAIACPPNINIFCNQPTDSSFTGVPTLVGCYDSVGLFYSDVVQNTVCPDSITFQIKRTWTAVDPVGTQTTCLQLVTAFRFDASQVVFPPDFDGLDSPKLSCNDSMSYLQLAATANTGIPMFENYPVESDIHCKTAVSYLDFVTPLCGDGFLIKREWKVVELCTPLTVRDTQYIYVVDSLAPAFQLPDSLFFSLSSVCSDSLRLPPAEITTECSSYTTNMATPWGSFPTNGGWTVPNQPSGYYPVVYTLTDACGNAGTDTVVVAIQDTTLVSCPPDVEVSCDFFFDTIFPALQIADFETLAELGMPVFPDNCEFGVSETDTVVINSCGVGHLERRMSSQGAMETMTCVQRVNIAHQSDFEVLFPADTSICLSPNLADEGEPVLIHATCEQLSTASTDMIVQSGLQGCYTIFRTWTVTNNCIFNGDTGIPDPSTGDRRFADGGDGYIEYTQTIHVNHNAPISFPNGCELPDLNLGTGVCEAPVTLTPPIVTGCGSSFDVAVAGELGTQTGSTVSVTPGEYDVVFTATDECGKMKSCSTTFQVLDLVPPTLLCKQNPVVVELMPNGQVTVWANDLVESASDNCGSNLSLSYSPNSVVGSQDFFCCQDEGLQTLVVWTEDAYGNQSWCEAEVIIQASMSSCDCNPTIQGTVEMEVGLPIPDVDTDGDLSTNADVTDQLGAYTISVAPIGTDVEVAPFRNDDPLNGVTTFDMVVIRKHILGVDTLDSPYKIIAADVNGSGAVTTADLVEIRKLVLQVTTELPNDMPSWRFVDASFVFPNPLNPFQTPFPQSILLNNVVQGVFDLDFIGIKLGDVNGSATP